MQDKNGPGFAGQSGNLPNDVDLDSANGHFQEELDVRKESQYSRYQSEGQKTTTTTNYNIDYITWVCGDAALMHLLGQIDNGIRTRKMRVETTRGLMIR